MINDRICYWTIGSPWVNLNLETFIVKHRSIGLTSDIIVFDTKEYEGAITIQLPNIEHHGFIRTIIINSVFESLDYDYFVYIDPNMFLDACINSNLILKFLSRSPLHVPLIKSTTSNNYTKNLSNKELRSQVYLPDDRVWIIRKVAIHRIVSLVLKYNKKYPENIGFLSEK